MIAVRITEKNVDNVLQNLKTTEDRLRRALGVGLSRGLQIAAGVAQKNYLSGPRPSVLDVVTTRLRGSIVTEVDVSNNVITGRIGSNVPYAAYHEFGFHGVENVKSHLRVASLEIARKNKLGTVFLVQRGGSKRLAKSLKRYDITNITGVRAHTRKIDYDGRPYLRPALEDTDIGGEITKQLQKLNG